ncbi:zinc finger protein 831 [Pyxicephalus adspersus]|uniref:zinc finger protein 831 n=1 Tax=Pyxicephalus adspersus TaxID=30357 RepID=UPI003B5D0591
MDSSNVSSLSSSMIQPTSTATLSGLHTVKESTVNDRTSAQAVLIKGVGVPVYQITQQEGQNVSFQLASSGSSFAIDNGGLSVVLAPQPQSILHKPPTQTLTLNIVNPLTVLSQNCPSAIPGTNPAKGKNIGKHICAHCGRDCLKPSVLEKHIRSHTGERPFPCTICGISFKTQSNLYKHRRTQTHVNNAKQSLDSDCAGCLEDQNTGQARERQCLEISKAVSNICIGKDHCEDNNSVDSETIVHENTTLPFLQTFNKEISSTSVKNNDHAVGVPDCASPIKDSMSMLNQKKSLKDPRTTTTNRHAQLQRQGETCIDKLLDCSITQRKLKKCESTDSGYLSHSDSADLQMFSSSSLHSLSECSFESEPMLNSTLDCEDKISTKKNLEEHISMLISKNRAVVDNTHLDNVRPRKTALSKQGSIDLPMPYTFKDSFHFDIKSLDVNRKKVSVCSVSSTSAPPGKNKPMFFHSVPTQISSSIDNVIMSRSNSLPFVENGRVQDRFPIRNTKAHLQGKQPLNVTFANLLLSNTATACTVDFSSSHPRGLVRQVAVDEVQTNNVSENPNYEESKECKKVEGDQLTPKSKAAQRKAGQKKVNMFSHEKWQMYGDETFKKFYQNIKSEHTKKTKQEVLDSKSEVRNETVLPTVMTKPSGSLSSLPSSDSISSGKSLFKTISVISKMTDATSPLESIQKVLDVDLESKTILRSKGGNKVPLNGKGNELKSCNPNHNSNVQAHCPQFQPLGQSNQSVANSNIIDNMVNERLFISNTQENMAYNFITSLQNNEQSPSERKKLRVAKKREKSLENPLEHSIIKETGQVESLESRTFKGSLVNIDTQQNMNFSTDAEILTRESLDQINRCDPQSSCILNDNCISAVKKDLEKGAQPFSIHSLPSSAQLTSTQKEHLFSPRYLIKFQYIGPSVGVPKTLQTDPNQICDLPTVETDLFSLSKCSALKLPYQHNIDSQGKQIQKHDSVIVPLSKISLNTECVCTGAATISIHVTQNIILDSKGNAEQKFNLDNMHLSRENKVQELQVLTELETSPYKECIASEPNCKNIATQRKLESDNLNYRCASPATTSQRPSEQFDTARHEYKLASTIAKCSHDSGLGTTNVLQTGPVYSTPVKAIFPLEQGSSSSNTAQLCWHSGICNVRVTKVTFSSLNTEPKSTWCWLDKCLPLPTEQKEKSFSVYASLNYNSIKDESPVQAPISNSESVEKYQPASTEQLLASSLVLKPLKQKGCSEEIKQLDANKFQQSAKRSSRMSARTKSRHTKRKKDSCRDRLHSKVPHRTTHKGICQKQRQKKTCLTPSLKSGDILQRTTTTYGSRDHADKITFLHHPSLQPGNKEREGGCGYGMDSQTNEGTSTKIASMRLFAPVHQLIAGEKSKAQLPEDFASLKFPQKLSVSWQKSCNVITSKDETTSDQLTSEIKRVHLQQDLIDGPPQKHGRKILHRSKTIGHSLGEETVGPNPNLALLNSSLPLLVNVDHQARDLADSIKTACSPSLQDSRKSVFGGCGPSDEKACCVSDLEQRSPKFQKKVNLELMRKQTHVEYSDSSSDDEDRLYIEIERE